MGATEDAMSAEIRRWREEDLPAIRDIAWATWLDTYSAFIPQPDLQTYLDTHYTHTALTALFHTVGVDGFVAETAGEIWGFARINSNSDDQRFYLSSLYVLPAHQGLGIGGNLLRAVEQEAVALGFDKIWLGVMEQNVEALAWYKKLGFHFIEAAPFTMANSTVNHLIGWKSARA